MTTEVYKERLFNAQSITASSTVYSNPVSLSYKQGFFALSWIVTSAGAGTLTIAIECSPNGKDRWNTPLDADSARIANICTSFGKTSGQNSDGYEYKALNIPVCLWVRLKVTETSGSAAATLTADLIIN